MTAKKIWGYALIHAIGTTAYIYFVAVVISNAERLFNPDTPEPLKAVAFLLTFVISAVITGTMVLGRPILWYIKGNRAEAIRLLFATILALVVIAAIVFLTLIAL